MAENTKGRHLLTDRDFRDVVDDEGNDLPPVPKHWGEDQLAPGASFKKSATKTAAKKTAAKRTTTKKAASSSTEPGGGSGGSGGTGSDEGGSSE